MQPILQRKCWSRHTILRIRITAAIAWYCECYSPSASELMKSHHKKNVDKCATSKFKPTSIREPSGACSTVLEEFIMWEDERAEMMVVIMPIISAMIHEQCTYSSIEWNSASRTLPNMVMDAQNKIHQLGSVMEILVNWWRVKISFPPHTYSEHTNKQIDWPRLRNKYWVLHSQ